MKWSAHWADLSQASPLNDRNEASWKIRGFAAFLCLLAALLDDPLRTGEIPHYQVANPDNSVEFLPTETPALPRRGIVPLERRSACSIKVPAALQRWSARILRALTLNYQLHAPPSLPSSYHLTASGTVPKSRPWDWVLIIIELVLPLSRVDNGL